MSTTLHDKVVTTADFGDSGAEFRTLLSGCGVYDLGARVKIMLTGDDRIRWLNGMATNNIRDLAVGHGVYSFMLNPQGRILADFYAYNRGDSLLIDTDQSQAEKVLMTFDHYIIMDDVQVADTSEKLNAIGVAGPRAREVLRAAGFDLPVLAPLQFVDISWRDQNLTIVRGDFENTESFELWLAPGSAAAISELLVSTGATRVGTTAFDLLRIASGIPRYGQDIRERDLPQETEQHRALNFSKGCYVGQEIVERIRSRGNVHRKFTGFMVEGPLPSVGTKIQAEGKDVGEITSAASLPGARGEKKVALGYIRREAATFDRQLDAGDTKLIIANLPFAEIFTH